MKKLILVVFLSGCMYQSVTNTELEAASKLCGGMTEIVSINSQAIGGIRVHCKDPIRSTTLFNK